MIRRAGVLRPLFFTPRTFSSVTPIPTSQPPANKERLIIFDTTLRDGEQSPGATLNIPEKVEIAKLLSKMGVDVCEAGFPIASPGDFEAVKAIAETVGPLKDNPMKRQMRIAGLSRARKPDIQRCFDAVKAAPLHRIHTFLATSDIHLEHKLKISRQQCIEQAGEAVRFARTLCDDVEFSTEDAGRSDPAFLVQVINAVISEGAKTINVPDTVGYTSPQEYQDLIAYLVKNCRSATENKKVIFSTHCHNDLGLATANTLAGVAGGARQVEVTVNGIGERAGNSALEEILMCLKTRPKLFQVYSDVDTTCITRASRMVSNFTGMSVQANKAIVGANAFAHEAGIHQDGVLKRADTYEIMDPKSVGLTTSHLVLGKHSGKAAYKARLHSLGHTNLTDAQLETLVQSFKKLADTKKHLTDADLEAIVSSELYDHLSIEQTWELLGVHVSCGSQVKSTATVTLRKVQEGSLVTEACIGEGPVDAIFQAIHKVVRVPNRLVRYQVEAVTQGVDAIGEVTTKLESPDDVDSPSSRRKLQRTDSQADVNEVKNPQTGTVSTRTFTGHGADTDILVASAKSYVSALNKMIGHKRMQGGDTRVVEHL